VTGVILAAGAGRRMGGTPKALLEVEGRTCLERVVTAAHDGGCGSIRVVVRPGASDVVALARELGAAITENPTPAEGMFSSVRLGVEHALAGDPVPRGVLLFPVDHPLVRADTVARLFETLATSPARTWVQPRHQDRGGHPIALDREAARALVRITPGRTLRQALDEAGLSGVPLPVADPGVLRNLNTPQDLV
jgi:CTP:molybdopterin cytidylyltransferase MocA